MNRRDLLLAGPAGFPGGPAPLGFPITTSVQGRRLVLNGIAILRGGWWFSPRCQVALYGEETTPATSLASHRMQLVEARFLRDLAVETVVDSWQARLSGDQPPAFRAWLRPVWVGDVERQVFQDGSVRLEGPGRLVRRIDHAGFARQLLGSWIGPEAGEMGCALRGGRT